MAAIPTLVLITLFVFTLQKLLPGDPVLTLAGEERDPQVLDNLRHLYHLDQPVLWQYLLWLFGVVQGDFGMSLRSGEPVLHLIVQKLPITLELAVLSLAIALAVGIPAGVLAALRKGTILDYGANVVALSGLSIPHFWLGLVLILLFSVQLHWLPSSGFVPFQEDPLQNLRALVLPSIVVGSGLAASFMRHTRAAMLATMKADYIRTARAKGLLPPAIILRHALRNALIPLITISTLLFGELMGGAVLTEQVFGIPGFGKMVVDAVFNRDYAVVQGIVLTVAIGFVLLNLLADTLYLVANPRLRSTR
jgi:peptide/nickel transport system permease protein